MQRSSVLCAAERLSRTAVDLLAAAQCLTLREHAVRRMRRIPSLLAKPLVIPFISILDDFGQRCFGRVAAAMVASC